jgi:RNA polymerase sigma-70 factor (ECF subfamily)
VAEDFEAQRERLVAVAYRILGSRADAEDAVQEAWLRLARQDPASIGNLAGWLTTVVGRICVDMLRSRTARPELLSEAMVVTEDHPEDDAVLADSVGVALLVVLDTLRPAERMAFVLHDVFAVPFEEIAQLLGRSPDATKMLASRARRKVREPGRRAGERQQQRAVVDAFLAAARDGDFEGLLRVLDPDVVWRTRTRRGVVVRLGATEVVAQVRRGDPAKVTARRVLVDGEPGILAWSAAGRPLTVMACTVTGGRITAIDAVVDPGRLAAMDLPKRPQ